MLMETPTLSDEKLNRIILTWSVASGVADITPIIGADLAAVAICQFKMFSALAREYGVTVTKERFIELLSTLVAGTGGWAATIFGASTLIQVFPGIGSALLWWQPPAIAAFTWAMGQVLKSYFPLVKEGKTWDKNSMKSAMKEALRRAKSIDWKKELGNLINWEKLILVWKSKSVIALGEEGAGKTTLSQFLQKGSIDGKYMRTTAPQKLEGRQFQLKNLNLKIKQILDFPGSNIAVGGAWKDSVVESWNDNPDANLVLYLVRAHFLKRQNRQTIHRVENDLKHIGHWLSLVRRKPACFFIVVTHCDLDQDYRDFKEQERLGEYEDAFRKIPVIMNGVLACGGWNRVKIAVGSLKTEESAAELVVQIFSQLPL
jgi:uncharacterized protein (DUF697 family)